MKKAKKLARYHKQENKRGVAQKRYENRKFTFTYSYKQYLSDTKTKFTNPLDLPWWLRDATDAKSGHTRR